MRYLIIIIFCLFIISFYVHVEHSSVLNKYHNKFIPIKNDAFNKKIVDQYNSIKEMEVKLNKISTSLDSFKIEKVESFEIDDRNFDVSLENNDLDNNYSDSVTDGRSFGFNKKESQKFDSLQIAESYFESATTNSLKFKYVRNPDGTESKVEYTDYNYQISQINWSQLGDVILFTHDKDTAETRSTLSFLTKFDNIKFFDLSDTKCKKKKLLADYHGIALTKCFAKKDPRSKEIINYLNKIY